MLTLKKNKLSSSQKLFVVFLASFMPFIFAIICQLDILATLKAAFLVLSCSVFCLYRGKHKNTLHLD